MKTNRSRLWVLASATVALQLTYIARAVQTNVIILSQSVFIANASTNRPDDYIVVKLSNGTVVAVQDLPTLVRAQVDRLHELRIPEVEVSAADAPGTLDFLWRMPNESVDDINLGAITASQPPMVSWAQNLQTNVQIDCNVTNVTYLEYSLRAAHAFGCAMGFLEDGAFLFGKAGTWPTNAVYFAMPKQ